MDQREILEELLSFYDDKGPNNFGSVAKNILTTFYSGSESRLAAISCVVTEFLQQSHFCNRALRRERTLATTRIASWDARVKGIDDSVVRKLPITSISVQRWLDRLSQWFRQIAMTRLSEIAAFPAKTRNVSGSQSC